LIEKELKWSGRRESNPRRPALGGKVKLFAKLLGEEVAAPRQLEKIAFGETPVHVYRSEVVAETGSGKVT
jgi:hypothetical protein